MPFSPPYHQFNGHLQTIFPAFRRVEVPYRRERIDTSDGDFLDLDWLRDDAHDRLVVLSHGLEGNSRRPYVTEAARYFFERGWDVVAWMSRSCSGEMNRTPLLYNHGQSDDLATVVEHVDAGRRYGQIVLIGYSMGGSLTLKYLGEAAGSQPGTVTHGIAFSAPARIEHSVDALEQRGNYLYKRKFYNALRDKIVAKVRQFPNVLVSRLPEWERLLDDRRFGPMPRWRDFDQRYSAPLNGFADATAFYHYASAANFMADTRVPLLLVNAKNDPIIPRACTPLELNGYRGLIHIEEPDRGGHVGFHLRGESRWSWMEERAEAFIKTTARSMSTG